MKGSHNCTPRRFAIYVWWNIPLSGLSRWGEFLVMHSLPPYLYTSRSWVDDVVRCPLLQLHLASIYVWIQSKIEENLKRNASFQGPKCGAILFYAFLHLIKFQHLNYLCLRTKLAVSLTENVQYISLQHKETSCVLMFSICIQGVMHSSPSPPSSNVDDDATRVRSLIGLILSPSPWWVLSPWNSNIYSTPTNHHNTHTWCQRIKGVSHTWCFTQNKPIYNITDLLYCKRYLLFHPRLICGGGLKSSTWIWSSANSNTKHRRWQKFPGLPFKLMGETWVFCFFFFVWAK